MYEKYLAQCLEYKKHYTVVTLTIIIPDEETNRLREVKCLVQGHTAIGGSRIKTQIQVCLTLKLVLLIVDLHHSTS